jgi:TMEM175 potassium channel family protein
VIRDEGEHRETARLEAFSDGVFAIALTILVLDLRLPPLEKVTSGELIHGVLDLWPTYFAFALSFATILIMWINHHARMGLIARVDGLLMFANGLVLIMVVSLAFPTALVGQYLTGPAGEGAVFVYAMFVLGTSGAWNVFMLAMKPERGLLRSGVPAEQIATIRRRVASGFAVYVVAAGLALVNAYLGLALITAMWGFWGTVAYRALNEHRAQSAEA